ncbi:ankyrin [Aspergillus steynii IBT 23096]|uniref:Ankyrin n=1 Tax=Aspergillus steynii IBT 23096 TaxID=1392250 RepID=A0A2I2G3V1_9EURO|nr:ankyrin [Aspergillus steynii IBT 23096]PLB47556.1 ankyrin [Aspergillus steynii IBT 23096]
MNFELFAKTTREKQYDGLQVFLDHGWDINAESILDSKVPSALIYTFDDPDLATWFLKHGADPNKRCQLRDATPLSYAIFKAPFEIIELFFQYGGSTEHGQLLHYASMRLDANGLEIPKYLLSKSRRVMDSVNRLLDEGYLEYTMDFRFGLCTPVQYAARAGSLASVRFLVEHGADPWRLDPYKRTALSYAVRYHHEPIEYYLKDLQNQFM